MDIQVAEAYVREAAELHHSFSVVDAHLDLAGEILLRHRLKEEQVIKKRYLKNFQSAGIRLVFSSIYVEDGNLSEGLENALAQIREISREIEALEEVMLVRSKQELEQVLLQKKIGILLYMEGLECIGEDVDKLDMLYEKGVRGASLVWSRQGALATGCCRALEHRQIQGGLSEAGVRAVKRLEKLSMFLDVSHLNDEGYGQVCRIAEKPFLATHSGSRSVYDSYRNMTDEQMRLLAEKGGIMGVNGCKYIAGSLSGEHLQMLCRHIEHEAEVIGTEHIGYGFDLCDPYSEAAKALQGKKYKDRDDCLLNHGQIPLLSAALLQRGMKKEELIEVIGGNFIRYLKNLLPD